jgi:hypothetical protein
MNEILLSKQSEVNLNSPQEVIYTSQSYFDTITKRLDSWQGKRLAQQEKRAQLVKTLLVKDKDSLTGITRTFRITTELIATEQANNTPALTESEVNSYVS